MKKMGNGRKGGEGRREKGVSGRGEKGLEKREEWEVKVERKKRGKNGLRQLPAVSSCADDSTLSFTYPRHKSRHVAAEINQQLKVILEWLRALSGALCP